MAYFKEKTLTTNDPGKQNAIIMGRKTWLSIPERMRPLAGRINVVLTTTQVDLKGAHHVTDSFEKALAWLNSSPISEKVEKIFVVGGETVYKVAMDSKLDQVIYLTRVLDNFECDTFFPQIDTEKYTLTESPDVPNEIQEESGIKYKYEMYLKRKQ